MISVIINDFQENTKTHLNFRPDEIDAAMAAWEEESADLIDLGNRLAPFAGYASYSELAPNHLRLLISRCLNALNTIPAEDRADADHPIVKVANTVILFFIFCIEENTGSVVEHLRINRYDDIMVSHEVLATFPLRYEMPLPKGGIDTPRFSIIEGEGKDDDSED